MADGTIADAILDDAEAAARAGALVARIDTWGALAPDDERHWIARALRLDLALLVEAPDLVLSAVHRRCAWLGAAAEADFYDGVRAAVRPGADALRARMAQWAAIATARGPWLRSLRPPPVPLDAAAIEEYRTDARGAVVFADDGATLGIAGALDAAWTRGTGARVTRALEPAAAPRWRLGGGATWGPFVIADGRRDITVPLGDDERVTALHDAGGHGVLASIMDLDQASFALLFDPARGEVRWRVETATSIVGVAATATSVLIAAAGEVVERAARDAAVIARFAVPAVASIARSPDGRWLATRSGAVLRVWDLARAGAAPAPAWRARRTWIAATFSPDGRRLITDDHLCDGGDGRSIARLALDGPGWLEGGPPERARRLADDRLIEATPFGETIWETETGTIVREDRARRALGPDQVVYDPTARWLVRASGRRRELAIERVDDGAVRWRGALAADVHDVVTALGMAAWIEEGGAVSVARVDGGVAAIEVRPLGVVAGSAPRLAISADRARLVVETTTAWQERDVVQLELATGAVVARARTPQRDRPGRLPRALLDGWSGLRLRPHPLDAEIRDGVLALAHDQRGTLARQPVDDDALVDGRDGARWAGPLTHVALDAPAAAAITATPRVSVRRDPGDDLDVAHLVERRGDTAWYAVARGLRPIGPAAHVAAACLDAARAALVGTAGHRDVADAAGHALERAGQVLVARERAARACLAEGRGGGPDGWGIAGWLGSCAAAIVVVIRGDRAGVAYAGDVRCWRARDGVATSMIDDARAPTERDPIPRVLLIDGRRIALDLIGSGERSPSVTARSLRPGDQLAIDAAPIASIDRARLTIVVA